MKNKWNKKVKHYTKAYAGMDISAVLNEMAIDATNDNVIYREQLNGIYISAHPGSSGSWLYKVFHEVQEKQHETWLADESIQSKLREQRRIAQEQFDRNLAEYKEKIASCKVGFECIDNEKYDSFVIANRYDSYGSRTIEYAHDLARMIELDMSNGITGIESIEKNKALCDYDGISGNMYWMAIGILREYWKYGEELFPRR